MSAYEITDHHYDVVVVGAGYGSGVGVDSDIGSGSSGSDSGGCGSGSSGDIGFSDNDDFCDSSFFNSSGVSGLWTADF